MMFSARAQANRTLRIVQRVARLVQGGVPCFCGSYERDVLAPSRPPFPLHPRRFFFGCRKDSANRNVTRWYTTGTGADFWGRTHYTENATFSDRPQRTKASPERNPLLCRFLSQGNALRTGQRDCRFTLCPRTGPCRYCVCWP